MSDESKPQAREWMFDKDFDVNCQLHVNEKFEDVCTPGDIHVIEYSEYERVCKERDELKLIITALHGYLGYAIPSNIELPQISQRNILAEFVANERDTFQHEFKMLQAGVHRTIKERNALKLQAQALADALDYANGCLCRHTSNLRPGNGRQWCCDCSSWVYQTDTDGLKKIDEALSAYNQFLQGEK